ncbi:MAG: tRNA preQ1(34) S-adenosylmethionine ribosyltransferase-isomerase QueA [Elusimicrobia bacterium]|nr:tRNA preQ1(34) S-adenosylmethionine ribosyltransferase-isomerase QueA [Elusimicrobiota bacterium]
MPALPLDDYDFPFPEELVADRPVEPRDSCKLMVVERFGPGRRHLSFRDLPDLLEPGDCLVLNRSKVLFCRLAGRKSTGGRVELLLAKELGLGRWAALSSGLKAGMSLEFPGGMAAAVEGLNEDGEYVLRFGSADLKGYLQEHGLAPLPPYILKKRREADPRDRERYQTVYAKEEGSIAAPTAGLHFTEGLLARLANKGVVIAELALHVGRGTFRPIQGLDASLHRMLPEYYILAEPEARKIKEASGAGRRLIAVGTTATRTLESLARRPEGFGPGEGWTELYIHPGCEFKLASGLLTNFHLPKSTPLLLAAAFLGREKLLACYREAFERGYRLYSYGDAMLAL